MARFWDDDHDLRDEAEHHRQQHIQS